MISAGDWSVQVLADKWTAVTQDRSLSAHFEHTVALTSRGPEILSSLDDEGLSFLFLKENQYGM